MTKDYHITPEEALEIAKKLQSQGFMITVSEEDFVDFHDAEELAAFANAALDEVLGEPVGEVEVRKQRILVDTFQQVTTPIADGRHKLYAPKEPTND